MYKEKNKSKQLLKDIRITVRNILFLIGLPTSLAQKTGEELSEELYFGQHGKILKITINDKPYIVLNQQVQYFLFM